MLDRPVAKADNGNDKPKKGDVDILIAAEIAEALAVTTYSNIINNAPFFLHIPGDDQDYLKGALQEEMSHYLLEQSVTGKPSPFTSFYYPKGNVQQRPNHTQYSGAPRRRLHRGVPGGSPRLQQRDDFKVTSARIMGIESDHRTLGTRGGERRGAAGWR